MANVSRYCCCGGGCIAGNACTNCDDGDAPADYEVTFSGITDCTACVTVGGVDVKVEFLDTVNATFTLEQSPGDDCIWLFQTTTDYVRVKTYLSGDGTCNSGGASDVDVDDEILIRLTRNATTWDLLITTGSGQLFCDTQTADTDGADQLCATVPSFTNDIVTCGAATCPILGEDFNQATGGTATVTCVGA